MAWKKMTMFDRGVGRSVCVSEQSAPQNVGQRPYRLLQSLLSVRLFGALKARAQCVNSHAVPQCAASAFTR